MPDSPPQLAHLEYLGDATKFASQLHALIPRCALLENFSPAEVLLLAHFLEVYRAEPGVEIIQEGDGGDFLLMVVEGKVEVQKRDRWNTPQTLAVVTGGRTLGEMSMIDGEARFATCVAAEPTLIAVSPSVLPPVTTASVCGVFQRSRFCTSTLPSTTISMKSPPSPSWMISTPGSARYTSRKCAS